MSAAARTAVITGANGFVGSHLCAELARLGWEVRVISRGLAPAGARRLDVDLFSNGDALSAAMAGADTLFHLAGIAHERVPATELDALNRLNVDTTIRLLAAADMAGVPQMVWLSSIKVLGDVSHRPLRPNDPYQPGDAYARSKVRAEQALQDHPARTTHVAVVRPPLVYGSGVRGNFRALMDWVARGVPLPLRRASSPRSLVGVGNLCSLLVRLSEPRSGIFHVADGDDLSVADLVQRMSQAFGRSSRLWSAPPGTIALLAQLARRPGLYSRLFHPLQVDQSETAEALDWRPPHSVAWQMQETVSWFRAQR